MLRVTKFKEAKKRFWHNALPLSEFYDPRYGKISITKDLAEQMVKNFKDNIPSYNPPVNISHIDELGKYGEVVNMEVRDDGLWIEVELTDEGAKLLEERKFEYLSAEYVEEYRDKKTNKNVGAVFIGVALTNKPAHPEMKKISFEDLMSEIVKLKEKLNGGESMELEKKLAELENQMKTFTEQIKLKDAELKELSEEVTKLKDENKKLLEEKAEQAKKLHEAKVEKWAKEWLEKGITPATIEKAKEKVLSDEKLFDVYNEIFESMPKIEKKQMSEENNGINVTEKAEKIIKFIHGGE
ncbi:Mu-like prophage I protein [Marinitoga hydrogenitolerans DSM 16785]|uniref:Mu-like prophage I protein n=1 Tax=Marinitoga hydrogenitolerans (strain DSM 16785 / JCM 12826 / AT1271) TaxID=1122195 RepID=A0A1M4TTV5_MARH1|nr:phage protease [Marinitoga hydrogenitolerans]SHE47882.1 Mu-like prophage I protein [Marinitoga hydrogenitolerans DSM 16785]